jgi:predicted RNA-binding protein YlxR (DUF448 family)
MRRRPARTDRSEAAPLRTCVGCRRVRSQAALLRLVRTPEGFVEPDPDRRRAGRGAYVCPSEGCMNEAVRRGRWAQVFRAPAALAPPAIERLRALIQAEREPELVGPSGGGVSVKGGW